MIHGPRVRYTIDRLRMRQENDDIKSLGQHFLNNEEILDETIALADTKKEDLASRNWAWAWRFNREIA